MMYAIRIASVTGSFSEIVTSPDRAAARRYAAMLIRALRLTSAHRRFTVEPIESRAQPSPSRRASRRRSRA